MSLKCPWPGYDGAAIHEGDTLLHPSGESGVVIFLKAHSDPQDAWRVDYGDGFLSRLALQIGDKGRASVKKP